MRTVHLVVLIALGTLAWAKNKGTNTEELENIAQEGDHLKRSAEFSDGRKRDMRMKAAPKPGLASLDTGLRSMSESSLERSLKSAAVKFELEEKSGGGGGPARPPGGGAAGPRAGGAGGAPRVAGSSGRGGPGPLGLPGSGGTARGGTTGSRMYHPPYFSTRWRCYHCVRGWYSCEWRCLFCYDTYAWGWSWLRWTCNHCHMDGVARWGWYMRQYTCWGNCY
ncbi:unnamed protein product [Owenia fusiformis]|uniref:Uncharacterized protein n=1 Tax=Owenia fusiformis TaxID=6347 RepID=A0A8J1Y408_OWEFU|nr:unnamed protein product [Owenia fusiformis]